MGAGGSSQIATTPICTEVRGRKQQMLKVAQCTLPYPDRFQVASQYVHAQETEGRSISHVLVH